MYIPVIWTRSKDSPPIIIHDCLSVFAYFGVPLRHSLSRLLSMVIIHSSCARATGEVRAHKISCAPVHVNYGTLSWASAETKYSTHRELE